MRDGGEDVTLREAIIDVYEMIGEPSDLPIYTGGAVDATLLGSIRIAAALNAAQDVIGTWRLPNGRQVYFRALEKEATFEPRVLTGTLGSQTSPWKTLVLPGAFGTTADRFVDWILTSSM